MPASLHLLLPLWSRIRCDDFLAIGARTLLAPGNLPVTAKRRRVVVQVFTTKEDWRYLNAHAVTMELRCHAALRPIFFVLEPEVSKHITMSQGHRIMLEAAAAAGALAVPIFADSVLADGDLTRLLNLAKPPRRMIMTLGWRIAYEELIGHLPAGRDSIALPPRELVRLSLVHRHSQMRCWSAASPGYGDDILGGPQWDVGDHGVVTHSIYWEPALIDFSHEWEHDSSPVLEWTIDGHYPWANLPAERHYHAVVDSDEFFHVTFARETGPLAYHFDHTPMRRPLVEEMRRARGFRATDPLRQRLYDLCFKVHSRDLDASWDPVVARAAAAVRASAVEEKPTYTLVEHAPPWLICTVLHTNVVRYEGRYYTIPHHLGPTELDHADQRTRPGIEVHDNEDAARRWAMTH